MSYIALTYIKPYDEFMDLIANEGYYRDIERNYDLSN